MVMCKRNSGRGLVRAQVVTSVKAKEVSILRKEGQWIHSVLVSF